MPSSRLSSFSSEGYILIPSLFNPDEIHTLRTACSNLSLLAESGKWPYLRTLPRQFPPWSSDPSSGIWGLQHLLHPDNPYNALFASTYFCDPIITAACELLSCTEDNLVMELYNLLITPTHDFSLRWHRDDIPPEASPAEEELQLSKPATHAQWNLALYDDDSLIVIPGSHARARSDAERAMEPYKQDAPGQKIVHLKAGDAVFYDNNILHRGVYDAQVPRMTLHGSMGLVKGDDARARNVLQHGVREWVERCDFAGLETDGLRGRAERMRGRLLQMGDAYGDVGYSQHD